MAIKYTEEQLNTVDKSLVIQMLLTEQEHTEQLTKQVAELNAKLTAMDEKMQKLIDQLILANKNRRKIKDFVCVGAIFIRPYVIM